MPKNNNLPLCPGYGDAPCPVGERVRALGRKYGAHCAKLSRAGFKAMMAANAEEREQNAERWNNMIALAMDTPPEGAATSLTISQPRCKFANHLERIQQGRRDSHGYHITLPSRSQALALRQLLTDDGIGVKAL